MEKKFFTLYWLGGSKNIIIGETIEQAFTAAGYGAGAVKAVDWYDEGITNTHRYVKNTGWEKKTQLKLSKAELENTTTEWLLEHFDFYSDIVVEFDNKDQISIKRSFGSWSTIGWVESIYVLYAEYHQGTYYGDSEDEKNQHHYMVTGGQHFKPEDIELAITVFKARLNSDKPQQSLPGSETLEEIAETQPQYR